MNANSSKKSLKPGLNNLFAEYLEQFSLNMEYADAFREQMRLTINDLNKDSIELNKSLLKRKTELEEKLEKLEKKYIFDGLDIGTYNKYKSQLSKTDNWLL